MSLRQRILNKQIDLRPTEYLTKEFPPEAPEDFIGQSARTAADSLVRIVADSLRHDHLPIKIFWAGETGSGKTSLTYFLCHLLKVDTRFAFQEYNGTDMTIDVIRDITQSLALSHNDLFGEYRVIAVQEADAIPSIAQTRWLTTLDNLPRRTAVVCTSNCNMADLQKRFQRRFKYSQLLGATTDELKGLIELFGVPPTIAQGIAAHSQGSPGIALTEAEEWLQTAVAA